MDMVRHAAYAIQLCPMASNIAVGVGIELTLVCFLDSRNATIGAEHDMINQVGVTHNPTKITLIS
jgi:hypothetical protein